MGARAVLFCVVLGFLAGSEAFAANDHVAAKAERTKSFDIANQHGRATIWELGDEGGIETTFVATNGRTVYSRISHSRLEMRVGDAVIEIAGTSRDHIRLKRSINGKVDITFWDSNTIDEAKSLAPTLDAAERLIGQKSSAQIADADLLAIQEMVSFANTVDASAMPKGAQKYWACWSRLALNYLGTAGAVLFCIETGGFYCVVGGGAVVDSWIDWYQDCGPPDYGE